MRQSLSQTDYDPARGRSGRLTARNAFLWFFALAGGIVLVCLITAMIYDGLSGFDPIAVTLTGVIEGLNESGEGEWGQQTSLIIRLDDGHVISVKVPASTFIRIGGKILVSERSSRAFHVKHYFFLKSLD